jgi:hypothetical protein
MLPRGDSGFQSIRESGVKSTNEIKPYGEPAVAEKRTDRREAYHEPGS